MAVVAAVIAAIYGDHPVWSMLRAECHPFQLLEAVRRELHAIWSSAPALEAHHPSAGVAGAELHFIRSRLAVDCGSATPIMTAKLGVYVHHPLLNVFTTELTLSGTARRHAICCTLITVRFVATLLKLGGHRRSSRLLTLGGHRSSRVTPTRRFLLVDHHHSSRSV